MRPTKTTSIEAALAVLALLGSASHAVAYIGPGAGSGAASGIGVGGWIVMIVVGGLGLGLLCGLIAIVIAAADRFKAWTACRREADLNHPRAADRRA